MNRRPGALRISVAAALLVASCRSPSGSGQADKLAEQTLGAAIAVESPAFAEAGPIPSLFSCNGDDVSPPLSWSGVPHDAVELALVVDDPDARRGTYVHWVLFGLDPSLAGLEAGELPSGASQAKNSAGDAEYKGPCPPGGDDAHRYRFTVYALSEEIAADDGAGTRGIAGATGTIGIFGIPTVNLDANGQTLTVLGSAGDDNATFTPSGTNAGRLTRAESAQVLNLAGVATPLVVDPGAGTDTLTVNGTTAADTINAAVDIASMVQVNSLLAVDEGWRC